MVLQPGPLPLHHQRRPLLAGHRRTGRRARQGRPPRRRRSALPPALPAPPRPTGARLEGLRPVSLQPRPIRERGRSDPPRRGTARTLAAPWPHRRLRRGRPPILALLLRRPDRPLVRAAGPATRNRRARARRRIVSLLPRQHPHPDPENLSRSHRPRARRPRRAEAPVSRRTPAAARSAPAAAGNRRAGRRLPPAARCARFCAGPAAPHRNRGCRQPHPPELRESRIRQRRRLRPLATTSGQAFHQRPA